MKCKQCGEENGDAKRTCSRCGAFLEGYTLNNVTGEYGYRGADGNFYKSEEEYRSQSSAAVQWADEHPRKGLVDLNKLWHDVSEEADLSNSVLLYDEKGGYMSPPCKFPFKDMPGFVDAMNRKFGAHYTKWIYMNDILPSKED